MKTWHKVGLGVLIVFAVIGFAFVAVFIAMQFGLLNVRGSIASRNGFFTSTSTQVAPAPSIPCTDTSKKVCNWNETPEWAVVHDGLKKDAAIINRVSSETGVSSRLIATVVVPEQIRFFTSERETFKRYFEPLKILGSLSQFSLGVSGIKQDTANNIELYANTPDSPFYPGPGMSDLIAYKPGVVHDTELYNRLTDDKNHYYSYLYTALFIKEIESQWKNAGFPIDGKPEVVGTLFNIGFKGSSPKPNPQTAGAAITTGGTTYTFGELGADFYNSLELRDSFFN